MIEQLRHRFTHGALEYSLHAVRQMIGRARVSADGVGVGRLVGRHESFTGDPVPAGVYPGQMHA